jgi:alkyldihydroxyacetonephosphate synthase
LSDFLGRLPPEIVVEETGPYRSDWWALALLADRSGNSFPEPAAALRPRSTEEVSMILRAAKESKTPIVARGGGSGVCGAAIASEGAVILDLTGMETILNVDRGSLVVTAQAGVSGPKLESVLNESGMTLGHIPQSFHVSTLGGWVGTKATGQLSTKYGGIEDRVLGLSAVLADGTIVSSKASPRSSTGPDWWRMFIGSEGTLGVVTEASLECLRQSESFAWLGFAPATFASGLDLFREMIQRGLAPSVARIYDEADAAISFSRLGISGPVVIMRFEGTERLIAAEVDEARNIFGKECEELGDGPGLHWWDHRFNAVETYRRLMAGEGPLGPHAVVDTMEVAAFWGELDRLYDELRSALASVADGVLAHASHLYASGANIYFTILMSSSNDDAEAESRYRAAWDAGMKATMEAGGTISHHHGIGLLKQPWLEQELGSGMEALRRLKAAFDPDGLMNPGKLGLGE